ncbi:MAG: urease accessory protein UreD [Rubrimonas sp.]|uniref:urease accessory protein UreD n=1 Tax=Rubrimonas sp. TaxID=2036015 RepID=UPI002FDD5E3F
MRCAPALQRARGRVDVAFALRDGASRLRNLAQEGSAKALAPRVAGPVPLAVLVNTAGGATGGDLFRWRAEVGAGAALTVSTQAAERIYRSTGADAQVETRLALAPGARLDWLPQETILFEGSRLSRRIDVEMAGDARLTAVEALVFGRSAMGERLTQGALSDQWRIRRDGRLIHAEALRIADFGHALAARALAGGALASATLLHVAPDAADRLDEARALARDARRGEIVEAAASLKPGVLIARFLSADARALRRALTGFLTAFRGEAPPRVWAM